MALPTPKSTRIKSGVLPKASGLPPRLSNSLHIEHVPIGELKSNPSSARRFKQFDERTARQIFAALKFIMPIIADDDGMVIVGEVMFRAAQQLGIETLPVIRIRDLPEVELQALSVAYQRLGELGQWDRAQLTSLVMRFEVEINGFQHEHVGFEVGEIDLMIGEQETEGESDDEEQELPFGGVAVSKVGDVWMVGKHRIVCGDSTDPGTFVTLMAGCSPAAMMFTDPPFGCTINGFVAGEGRHREFVMGSGEMSPDQLSVFFAGFIAAVLPHLKAGAVVEIVIDWRSLHLLLNAAAPLLGPLINLAVWAKDRAGQGSFLRSQHELVLIFKVGKGRFRNNVQLGRHGRNRSNVWTYPSAKTASTGSDEGDLLKHHPTPKPIRLVADAIIDCSRRGDIVVDAFLGSGTTLIAAEKVGRVCHGVELDPIYVDLAIRRWQAWTGEQAVHQASGKTFDDLAAGITDTL